MDEIANRYRESLLAANTLLTLEMLADFHDELCEHMALRKFAAYCLQYILHGMKQTPNVTEVWPTTNLKNVMMQHQALTLEYLELVEEHPHETPVLDPRKLGECVFHQHAVGEPCSLGVGDEYDYDLVERVVYGGD
ncbi:hypothetical protein EG329_002502 [Mollisiaceae sp. DMI_Dod_QoI]|nr:hypothetical protein EG329_002502 [Helotiales sp. DMI_Dod_QoI]